MSIIACARCGASKWGPDDKLCTYCLVTKRQITAMISDDAPVLHRACLYELAATSARVDGTMDRIEEKVDLLARRHEQMFVALRRYETEVRAVLDSIPADIRVIVREGGGLEDELASLAVTVAAMVQALGTRPR